MKVFKNYFLLFYNKKSLFKDVIDYFLKQPLKNK